MEQDKLVEKYKLHDLETLLFEIENTVCEVIEKKDIKEAEDNINFLLYTIGKSIVTLREVIILCREGYPDGALSLARNIFEQFIHVMYIEKRCNDVDFELLIEKYYVNYNVQRTKNLKFAAEKIDCSKDKTEEYKEEIKDIREKYNIKKISDYWWSGVNSFGEMCDVVCEENPRLTKLVRQMQLLYKRACLALHSSCMGNRVRIGSRFPGIDMGLWDKGQEIALFLATSSLIQLVGCVYEMIDINGEEILKSLNKLAVYYRGLESK